MYQLEAEGTASLEPRVHQEEWDLLVHLEFGVRLEPEVLKEPEECLE